MSREHLNDSTLLHLTKAARWLQRLHQSPDDGALWTKCQRWQDACPENARAFERMVLVWQAIGQLAVLSPTVAATPKIPAVTARTVGHRRGFCTTQRSHSVVRTCVRETVSSAKQRLPHAAQPERTPAQE